jgi:hypothetical protein
MLSGLLIACAPAGRDQSDPLAQGALTQDAVEAATAGASVSPNAPARTLQVFASLSTQSQVEGVTDLFADRDLMTALVESRESAFWEVSAPVCELVEGWTVCRFCEARERPLGDSSTRFEANALEAMHIPLSSPATGETWRIKALESSVGFTGAALEGVDAARGWCTQRGYPTLSAFDVTP